MCNIYFICQKYLALNPVFGLSLNTILIMQHISDNTNRDTGMLNNPLEHSHNLLIYNSVNDNAKHEKKMLSSFNENLYIIIKRDKNRKLFFAVLEKNWFFS